jgi:hypothetical protein
MPTTSHLLSFLRFAILKFVGPYQALCNIFEGSKDTWKPNLNKKYHEISELEVTIFH